MSHTALNAWNRACEVPADIHDAHRDSKRPIFHPLGPKGWSSDPCGPILYKGRYHLFYQHQHASCQWYWGLCWDHVVSDDLVHWKNLPPAVIPTPGGLDADGCFSGTVEYDPELDVPVILYTGVYLKANAEAVTAHGLPALEYDPGTRFVEKQLAAVPANPDDPDLTHWVKLSSPVMALPPPGLNISCWRDPFCVQRPAKAGGDGEDWVVLLASGIRGVGGAVLRFKSKHFTYGWKFDGFLAAGENEALGIRAQDWECPILAQLPCTTKMAISASIAANTVDTSALSCAAELSSSTIDGTKNVPAAELSSLTILGTKYLPAAELSDLTIDGTKCPSSVGSSSDVAGMCPTTPLLLATPLAALSLSALSGATNSSISLSTLDDGITSHAAANVVELSALPGTDESTQSVPMQGDSSTCAVPAAMQTPIASASASPGFTVSLAAAAEGSPMAAVAAAAEVSPMAAVADMSPWAAVAAAEVAHCASTVGQACAAAAAAAPTALACCNYSSTRDSSASHPAVNVDAWVEQQSLQQQAATVARTTGEPSVLQDEAIANSYSVAIGSGFIPVSMIDTDSAVRRDKMYHNQTSSEGVDKPLHADMRGYSMALPAASVQSSTALHGSNDGSNGGSNGPAAAACDQRWWFCISPDACNNPITWWVGEYNGQCFDIFKASGPHRLDLGTTLYAATLWKDPEGRQLLYGWIQEHRRVPTPPALCEQYSYAGCISTPRVLQLVDGQLWQTPLPEINALRTSVSWHAKNLLVKPTDSLIPLQVVSGTHLDINLTMMPPPAAAAAVTSAGPAARTSGPAADTSGPAADTYGPAADADRLCAGLVFKSWRAEGKGAAVLSFDWVTCALMFDFDEPFPDAYNPHPEDTPDRRRVGGKLRNYQQGDPLSLRILLDGSAVEVFTSTGETLTTRMYRGHPPKCRCSGCALGAAAASSFAPVAASHATDKAGGQIAPWPADAAVEATVDAASEDVGVSGCDTTLGSAVGELDGSGAVDADNVPLRNDDGWYPDDETGIALFATSASVTVSQLDVVEMGSCWVTPSTPPPQPPALLQQQQQLMATQQTLEGQTLCPGLHVIMTHRESSSSQEDLEAVAVQELPQAICADVTAGTDLQSTPSPMAIMQQHHHPAGDQAVVKEDFLEDLNILNK